MKCTGNIGKYQLSQTIGEGAFAKVKRAKNVYNDQQVAIKIIDKNMIIQNKLMYQVQREIRTMKLLNHPNIVRIHEVLGSKTKIYIVMEYVPGGQLSDKLSYATKLSEEEARKLFQQLINAVDYCHCRGVYHRDLKPQNLLLDNQGNLKVSDFGLSALLKPSQPGSLLSTACGSPSYVAPELIRNRGYEGAAADIWACGVILFEMLSGYLPFNDPNVATLYKKILEADYKCPGWFTPEQKWLISRIFESDPRKRITMPEIFEDEWFQTDYEPVMGVERTNSYYYQPALDPAEASVTNNIQSQKPGFINAFKLISMSQEMDLSGLFEEKENARHRMIIGSKYTISETINRIEVAARDSSLLFERMDNSKIKMQPRQRLKSSSPCANLIAEVFEVAPTDCVVRISKSTGELRVYQQFCKTLTSLLEEKCQPMMRKMSKDDSLIPISLHTEHESSTSIENIDHYGYFSS